MPQEVADAVPFDRDYANCAYDAEYANRHWRILVSSAKVLQRFRAKFIGKCSPVHFLPGVHTFFRTARAGAQRRHQRPGLLARGVQRRLLAGRRRRGWSGVLLVYGASATRYRDAACTPHWRGLETAALRVHSDVRRRPPRGIAGGSAIRFLGKYV